MNSNYENANVIAKAIVEGFVKSLLDTVVIDNLNVTENKVEFDLYVSIDFQLYHVRNFIFERNVDHEE